MKKRLGNWFIALLLLVTLGVPSAQAGIRRVDKHATGTPIDGTTWARAYRDLQAALTTAPSGTDIWVDADTYTPGTMSGSSFLMRNDVHIYGAFPPGGGDGTFGARDVDNPAYETTLSGDIGVIGDTTDNCHIIVVANGVTYVDLDGFTLTGASSSALYCYQSSPMLNNLTFTGNRGGDGTCILNEDQSSPHIENCRFLFNASSGSGGAIANVSDSNPPILSCEFTGNEAGTGGAVSSSGGSHPNFYACTFSRNRAAWFGGAVSNGNQCPLTARNCTFEANIAQDGNGGAIWCGGDTHEPEDPATAITLINCDTSRECIKTFWE